MNVTVISTYVPAESSKKTTTAVRTAHIADTPKPL